jgi:hypothetical protein
VGLQVYGLLWPLILIPSCADEIAASTGLRSIGFLPAYSLQLANANIVGNLIGERKEEAFKAEWSPLSLAW